MDEDYHLQKTEDLKNRLKELLNKYENFKSRNLKLDISRGKPCPEQLDLSMEMLNITEYTSSDGTDCRNYGLVDGLPEAKKLFAELLDVSPSEVIVGGNSSLAIMHDIIMRAMLLGVPGSEKPWGKLPYVKFLCPSPGYDRHFAICELFGIEMISVEMKNDGPDMDAIEQYVKDDESIKGIWCTPIYSNPQGITYSDDVVRRFASMKTKAKDFCIFWDNAYFVHHLSDREDKLLNILEECKKAGNPDRPYIFCSTSKITFAGAGVAAVASSETNIASLKKQLSIQTIGPDKLNQLRHVLFFKNKEGIINHMKKHRNILKPKFDTVLDILDKELGKKNIAKWNNPHGGYFISLDTLDGCASKSVKMALDAGVTFTKAGATYPYGKDPRDRNIRIAPTYPPISELKEAIELLCTCIEINSIMKILEDRKNL